MRMPCSASGAVSTHTRLFPRADTLARWDTFLFGEIAILSSELMRRLLHQVCTFLSFAHNTRHFSFTAIIASCATAQGLSIANNRLQHSSICRRTRHYMADAIWWTPQKAPAAIGERLRMSRFFLISSFSRKTSSIEPPRAQPAATPARLAQRKPPP